MAIPLGLNELAKVDLVACDMSYGADKANVGIRTRLATYPDTTWGRECPYPVASGWEVREKFNDPSSGFKALAFINLFSNEIVIAMGGTDGPNTRDWLSNSRLGWDQWTRNKASIFSFIDNLGFTPSMIHFTGQSLGGGLAEYAAYDYLARANPADRPALKSRMTLVTFNGFGGEAKL